MLETAKKAVTTAGKIQMDNYGKNLNVDAKLKNDIKLEIDKLSEKTIINIIKATYPDHSILAEESGSYETDNEYLWIIDPLDGTVNYYYNLPYFCSSVACYKINKNRTTLCNNITDYGEPVCGAIYAGPTNELFYAEKDNGAFLNGQQIFAAKEQSLNECILSTGFGSTQDSLNGFFENGTNLIHKVRKIRCLGAAAYDIANVAAGRLSGFYEKNLNSWDIAAGVIIAQEAGATINAYETASEKWDFIVSAPAIAEELKQIVQS